MPEPMSRRRAKICFFVILALTLLPLLFFPVDSALYHTLYKCPQVKDGVLDLSGYDLARDGAIPLDGEWEFYYDRWIMTDDMRADTPDLMAPVPLPWHFYPGMGLGNTGIASYRLLLKNCPGGVELLAYIPNIHTRYRIYLNETLIATRGDIHAVLGEGYYTSLEDQALRQGFSVPEGSDAELVIEIASPHIGGLYMTPHLAEQNWYHTSSDIRNLLASAFIGIIVVAIGFVACLLLLRDRLLSSLALLGMDLLVFVRILFKNDYLSFLNHLFPVRDYLINSLLQIVTLFLPVVFLFCARQLLGIQFKSRSIRFIVCYELVFAVLIFLCSIHGRPHFSFLFCVISYLPFIYVMWVMYREVVRGVQHSLLVSAVLMLILSSMISASLSTTGWIIRDINLFPPTCFVLSMLLQLWVFIRRSVEVQRRAVEAENLQLRLKQSEASLMLSQIKPHFLYNTLLAIHMLCTEQPETAAEATLKFANFLRTNMNFISSCEMIPFENELAHIRNYADIELLRFQRRLTVRYEINATAFCVPPLSIQPLVENAIRHGACRNVKGGTVTLRTFGTDICDFIEVVDDGPGFDTALLNQPESLPHGLQNILFRLRELRGATVEIDSERGKGTCVRVTLPKEDAHEGGPIG